MIDETILIERTCKSYNNITKSLKYLYAIFGSIHENYRQRAVTWGGIFATKNAFVMFKVKQ